MDHPSLMIVGDAPARRPLCERFLQDGFAVLEAATPAEAIARIGTDLDVVLLDWSLAEAGGRETLAHIAEVAPDAVAVLVMGCAAGGVSSGAKSPCVSGCLYKPFGPDDAAIEVGKALEASRLRRKLRVHAGVETQGLGMDAMIGESPAMVATRTRLVEVAAGSAPMVLLIGETGTGKDLAARLIHHTGRRADHPFVTVSCRTLQEPLFESELFGYEPGAFTGASHRRRGLLEMADRGTVFLEDVGDLALPLQARLLRFLDERRFRRIGGLRDVHVDVRIIAATNRNLGADVAAGGFREDLWSRLRAVEVSLPPVRELIGDVARLAHYYVARYNAEFRKRVRGLAPEAMTLLERHRWPGNVRELRNAIERAMLLVDGDWIEATALTDIAFRAPGTPFSLPADGLNLREVECQLLVQALDRAAGNHRKAGRLLGLNRDQVRYRRAKFGLPARHGSYPDADRT